jgi:hypothetical protein
VTGFKRLTSMLRALTGLGELRGNQISLLPICLLVIEHVDARYGQKRGSCIGTDSSLDVSSARILRRQLIADVLPL